LSLELEYGTNSGTPLSGLELVSSLAGQTEYDAVDRYGTSEGSISGKLLNSHQHHNEH